MPRLAEGDQEAVVAELLLAGRCLWRRHAEPNGSAAQSFDSLAPGPALGSDLALGSKAVALGLVPPDATAARVAELPARYVAGYLHSDASGMAHQASHAWAEIFVAGLGWVGFDAANRCCPDDRYIRLCSGADALDAAPIRGVLHGYASEALTVDVSVAETGTPAHEAQVQQ